MEFGYSTDTYDCDGKATCEYLSPSFDRAELEAKLALFRGKFLQTPPPVSAKKISGTPAYKLARQNVTVSLKPVEVDVEWELLEFSGNLARLTLDCSAGTYVRSIAHDLGQLLGCGAFVRALRRTVAGEFTISQASTLDQLRELSASGRMQEVLIPAAQLLPRFPGALIDADTEANIRQGKDFRLSPFRPHPDAPYIKAISQAGELVAIGEARLPHLYHPVLVL